jgi:hypothetical protein
MLEGFLNAVQRAERTETIRQSESRSHVVARAEQAPKAADMRLKGVGGGHEVLGGITDEAVFLEKLGASFLYLVAGRLVLGAVGSLVFATTVADRPAGAASEELRACCCALRATMA